MSHPAIQRGHFEFQNLFVCDVAPDSRVRWTSPATLLFRAVVEDIPELDDGFDPRAVDLDNLVTEEPVESLIQFLGPFLRSALLDPGRRRNDPARPPIMFFPQPKGFAFVQVITTMN
ncbi:MAG: hypothetical protein AAF170_07725 [Bacteroidota bacterium]